MHHTTGNLSQRRRDAESLIHSEAGDADGGGGGTWFVGEAGGAEGSYGCGNRKNLLIIQEHVERIGRIGDAKLVSHARQNANCALPFCNSHTVALLPKLHTFGRDVDLY